MLTSSINSPLCILKRFFFQPEPSHDNLIHSPSQYRPALILFLHYLYVNGSGKHPHTKRRVEELQSGESSIDARRLWSSVSGPPRWIKRGSLWKHLFSGARGNDMHNMWMLPPIFFFFIWLCDIYKRQRGIVSLCFRLQIKKNAQIRGELVWRLNTGGPILRCEQNHSEIMELASGFTPHRKKSLKSCFHTLKPGFGFRLSPIATWAKEAISNIFQSRRLGIRVIFFKVRFKWCIVKSHTFCCCFWTATCRLLLRNAEPKPH